MATRGFLVACSDCEYKNIVDSNAEIDGILDLQDHFAYSTCSRGTVTQTTIVEK